MTQSLHLGLPFIDAAQAQKHITHNEALQMIDALVHLSVVDMGLDEPPSAAEGERYIIGASPSGAWSGHAGAIAAFVDGAWLFFTPAKGWLAYVESQTLLHLFDGESWQPARGTELQNLMLLGVNTSADATNKLAVKSSAVLFDNAGSGVQFKVNKNASGDTASLLFQTGYSGRAEAGLAGSDHFQIKVSPDGSAWHQAIDVDPNSGWIGVGTNAPATHLDVNGSLRAGSYTVAALPAGVTGAIAFASNGRKAGEGAGAGTGVLVVYSNGQWRRVSDDTQVAA